MDIDPARLHHAYLVIGPAEETKKELRGFFEKRLGFRTAGNPDFVELSYVSFGVDDARDLAALHDSRPVAGDRKIFLLSADALTAPAQNALLKIFEEPKGGSHFFLVVPASVRILDTLRSRMIVLDSAGKGEPILNPAAFLALPAGKRLAEIKTLAENIAAEKVRKAEAIGFLHALEAELRRRTGPVKSRETAALFEAFERAGSYAADSSASLKMLLEYLALLVPDKL